MDPSAPPNDAVGLIKGFLKSNPVVGIPVAEDSLSSTNLLKGYGPGGPGTSSMYISALFLKFPAPSLNCIAPSGPETVIAGPVDAEVSRLVSLGSLNVPELYKLLNSPVLLTWRVPYFTRFKCLFAELILLYIQRVLISF